MKNEGEKYLISEKYHQDFESGAYVNKERKNIISETLAKDYSLKYIKELHENSNPEKSSFFFEEEVKPEVKEQLLRKFPFMDDDREFK